VSNDIFECKLKLKWTIVENGSFNDLKQIMTTHLWKILRFFREKFCELRCRRWLKPAIIQGRAYGIAEN
jgi:hypothetical protein